VIAVVMTKVTIIKIIITGLKKEEKLSIETPIVALKFSKIKLHVKLKIKCTKREKPHSSSKEQVYHK